MIKFKKEYVELATKGLYRIGQAKLKRGNSNIEILKHKQGETISYDVCISRGNGWTWAYGVDLKRVYKILSVADKIGLANSFGD